MFGEMFLKIERFCCIGKQQHLRADAKRDIDYEHALHG